MSSLHVVFRVGPAEYCLPADQVLQLDSFTDATPVPGSPPYVSGVVQIRGRVVPVVNLRRRFGLQETAPTPDTRLVIGQRGERAVGLLVDSGREVLKLSEDQFRPPPSLIASQAAGFVKAIAQAGSRLLMLLDLPKLIEEEGTHAHG